MLVLTRKRFEMIQIGEDIVIKIIHTGRKTVKLGIDAPANIRVMRAELCNDDAPPASPNGLSHLISLRRARIEDSAKAPSMQIAK